MKKPHCELDFSIKNYRDWIITAIFHTRNFHWKFTSKIPRKVYCRVKIHLSQFSRKVNCRSLVWPTWMYTNQGRIVWWKVSLWIKLKTFQNWTITAKGRTRKFTGSSFFLFCGCVWPKPHVSTSVLGCLNHLLSEMVLVMFNVGQQQCRYGEVFFM